MRLWLAGKRAKEQKGSHSDHPSVCDRHLISIHWFRKWEKHVNYRITTAAQFATGPPGPIDNSTLVKDIVTPGKVVMEKYGVTPAPSTPLLPHHALPTLHTHTQL